jgi:catalase
MELDTKLGEHAWPDEDEHTARIVEIIERVLTRRYAKHPPTRRDAHPKAHGAVRAIFRVAPDLAPPFDRGVLVPGRQYPAWVRFSNGNGDARRPDIEGDARGMAVKLCGVPGDKLHPSESATQDLVCINHPVFFVDDPARYRKVFERGSSESAFVRALVPLAMGIKGALIAGAIRKKTIASPLECRYWSTVPYRLGSGPDRVAMKYSWRPQLGGSTIPARPGPDYLREAMANTLAERDAAFDFLVQVCPPDGAVEDTQTEWTEQASPFVKVATLTIPRQTFTSAAQDAFAENLSFTPWHALTEHKPLGVVNRVRRTVYDAISRFRHERNAAPRVEPTGDEAF